MDLTERWPQLADLAENASALDGIELWGFGSMLRSDDPSDLDVAVIYHERSNLKKLRASGFWELTQPPIDLIGLTRDEDEELNFLSGVGAQRL